MVVLRKPGVWARILWTFGVPLIIVVIIAVLAGLLFALGWVAAVVAGAVLNLNEPPTHAEYCGVGFLTAIILGFGIWAGWAVYSWLRWGSAALRDIKWAKTEAKAEALKKVEAEHVAGSLSNATTADASGGLSESPTGRLSKL